MTSAWWVSEGELDEDQVKVATLQKSGNHVIVGPPGSGKTNLLLLRARYLSLASLPNILVLVFTRTLQEFLRLGARQYGIDPGKIVNYREWQRDFLRQHGGFLSTEKDFRAARDADFASIERVLKDKKLQASYDAVLVDEAQDYSSEEIRLLARIGNVFYATADQRQRIYSGDEPFGALEAVGKTHVLRFHYRNGRNICRLADGVAKNLGSEFMLTPTSQYDEVARPSSVRAIRCADLKNQAEEIAVAIESELKAYPGEMLGVLCPRQEDISEVWSHLGETNVSQFCQIQTSNVFHNLYY